MAITAEPSSPTSLIFIRVRLALILPVPMVTTAPSAPDDPPSGVPPPPSDDGHLYVIEGSFDHINRYAGGTVDWIIKVAHLICDPLGTGQIYTHTTGTHVDWYRSERTSTWRQVAQGDVLRPGIYEFDSSTPIILSKISERRNRSVVSNDSLARHSSSTFSTLIARRDGGICVVSGAQYLHQASHLIPKRLGSDGAKDIVTRFSGPQAAVGIDKFDPRIGVYLSLTMDILVDSHTVGFYHVAVSAIT